MSFAARREVLEFVEGRFPGAFVQPLAGDASTRRFYRIVLPGGSTLVLMDYGAPFERETDDTRLSRLFEEAALPVARIEIVAPEPGCLVLADLGDRTLESILRSPGRLPSAEEVERLYETATDLALAIAVRGTRALSRSARAAGPALDSARFRFEMDFFLEHYAGPLRGLRSIPTDLRRELHALADAAASCSSPVFCHRDFHSRNLMVLPDRSMALVDIQDARWGPDTYDLASLLRDAYVDIEEGLILRMIHRYRLSLPSPPPESPFLERFRLVALERMIKALGTFGYQATVLGRNRYLEGVPRTLARLRADLSESPESLPLARALDRSGLLEEPIALAGPADHH